MKIQLMEKNIIEFKGLINSLSLCKTEISKLLIYNILMEQFKVKTKNVRE